MSNRQATDRQKPTISSDLANESTVPSENVYPVISSTVEGPPGRVRKLSSGIKDTLMRTFGRGGSVHQRLALTTEGKYVDAQVPLSSPLTGVGAANSAASLVRPGGAVGQSLPAVPADPEASAKKAKGGRMSALMAPQSAAGGTWGRSSSMDVPRPLKYRPMNHLSDFISLFRGHHRPHYLTFLPIQTEKRGPGASNCPRRLSS